MSAPLLRSLVATIFSGLATLIVMGLYYLIMFIYRATKGFFTKRVPCSSDAEGEKK